MLRISKLTDYGTVVLAQLAAKQDAVCSGQLVYALIRTLGVKPHGV